MPTTLNEINNSILDRLKGNTPVSLSGICLDEVEVVKDFKNCQNRHSVVITGYTEMCNKKNKCYRAFKVHNSWGEDWQKENSDGWVLADELLKKTSLEQGAITYIK